MVTTRWPSAVQDIWAGATSPNIFLSQGSRMDIFVATMLGELDIVKATLTAYPALITSRGPHGLTLLHRAQKGGEQARAVVEYLESAGAR
jgi:hypothetical protein